MVYTPFVEQASQSAEEKRPYHSHVRQRQAEETQLRILTAARTLFESCGYVVTRLEAQVQLIERKDFVMNLSSQSNQQQSADSPYRQLHRAFFALCMLLAPLTVSLW
jgi:hypothetical protein